MKSLGAQRAVAQASCCILKDRGNAVASRTPLVLTRVTILRAGKFPDTASLAQPIATPSHGAAQLIKCFGASSLIDSVARKLPWL